MLEFADNLLPLSAAASMLPSHSRPGQPVTRATLIRWIQHGVRVGRTRVRLGGLKAPGGYYTSRAWISRFLAETSRLPVGPTFPSAADRKQHDEAADYLRQHGMEVG